MVPGRRRFLQYTLGAGVSALACFPARAAAETGPAGPGYRLARDVPTKLFADGCCWSHPRAGIVPGAGREGQPRVVMTMNRLDLAGSDVFRAVFDLRTDDGGATWTKPREVATLAPRTERIDAQERPVAVSDFWPRWHAASKTLLGTGHSVVYTPDWKVTPIRPRHTVYATYAPETDAWSPWRKLAMPDEAKFANAGAGCTQRYDLPDGTMLLPFYFKPGGTGAKVAVMRCAFDGQTLRYLEHGDELGVDDATRGLGEPSLARWGERFFLTIRHNERGYVTRGRDGLGFEPLRPWTFDDGQNLGSYNTQTHWVTHADGLFLVYTRRGAGNDHVFRHRAPLFMAQVDPERLCVVRASEQILVPQRGARLGNFGVTDVSRAETWVTVAEWMQPAGVEKHGSDGSVWVARIHWNEPNRLVET